VRSFDEVRLFIAGDEYEVRALTAGELMRARAEARELARGIGAEDGDEAIVSAATVVSASLYLDGKRAFPAAADVLESLTLGELMEAAALNAVPEQRERKPDLSDGTEAAAPLKADAPTESEDAVPAAGEPESDEEMAVRPERPAEEPETTAREKTRREWPIETAASAEKRERGGLFSFFGGRQRQADLTPAAGERSDGRPMGHTAETAESGSADMRTISGFFERDSRRYDGVFERY